MEVLELVSLLFFAGSKASKACRKWRSRSRRAESETAGDVNIEVNLDAGDECESTECAIIAVGAELAMKAHSSWSKSRTRRNRGITGLSNEFAAHRREMRGDLMEMAATQQSASQAIAEELVGIRVGDLQTEKLTRGFAEVRTDLGTVIDRVDGVWNAVSNGVLEVNYTVRHGTAVIHRSLEGLQENVATMQTSIFMAQEENSEHFKVVSSKLRELEAYVKNRDQQQHRSLLEGHLKKARMRLNEFTGTGGVEFRHLDEAMNSCIDILVLRPHSDTLSAHFMAGKIAIATSFTKHAQQQELPARAKEYVFNGAFRNVIYSSFEPFWTDPSQARTPTGSRVVEFLLNAASAVCLLPPEGLLLQPLDPRLVEAFGVLCSRKPSLLDRFPEVGGAAVRALLQAKPLDELCRISNSLEVDISSCDNRADLIQAMLDERKDIDAAMNPVFPRTDLSETSGDRGSSNPDDDSIQSFRDRITAW
ncbi:unnamed protein product [Scytosiphon promiscuus]